MSIKHRSGCSAKRVFYVCACLAVTLAACCAAQAGVAPSHGVMLDVLDARLTEVVSLLTTQSGVNIFINTDAIGDKKVTAKAEGISLEKAIDLVVKQCSGVDYWKDEDGNYVIGGKRPVEAKSAPITEAPLFVPEPDVTYTEPVKLKTETVKLQNLSPKEILVALGVQKPSPDFFGTRVAPVVAIADEDEYTIEPIGRPLNGRPAGRSMTDTSTPALDPGSSGLDGSAGVSATDSTGSRQYQPPARPSTPGRTTGATNSSNTTTGGQNNLLPEGVEMVMPFALDNSLIVRGTEDGIAEFKDIVHLLDIAPKQVMVKAEFIEVSTDDVRSLGIDWSINRINQNFDTVFNPSGNVIYNLTTGNLTANLRTELSKSSGKTINAPIITMLNNEVGEIEIERMIPYWTSTTNTPSSGSATTSYSVNTLEIRTGLSVLPRVNGDGTITLTMAPEISDTGRIFLGPDGTEIPEKRTQSIAVRRRVMSGETIVCGGFIRKNDSFSESRVPILADLPIVGPLFRSTSKQQQDTELLIFVTPTIIGDRASGTSIGVSP